MIFAAKPERGLICISKFLGIDTARPVGIIADFPGLISISFQYLQLRSIPEDPSVSYFGKGILLDNLLINISVIN